MTVLPLLLLVAQAQINNGSFAGLANPAHPGDYLSLYGTYPAGQVSVSVAGLPVPVTYSGPDQINVYLPPNLAAPDSCYDALTVSIAGAAQTPQPLSFTASSVTCPSPFGFNPGELADIDAGVQETFVQLMLGSFTTSSTSGGFTRSEFAFAGLTLYTPVLTRLNYTDQALYTCQSLTPNGGIAVSGAFAYTSPSLTMGTVSIPIGPGSIVTTATTPDTLPPSIFQPGTWRLTAPNFSQPLHISPPIELQNLASLQSIDSTKDLTITWNPAGYIASDLLNLNIGASAYLVTSNLAATLPSYVSCNAPATSGTLTIPAALLQSLTSPSELTVTVSPHPDQTPNFRRPQSDGSTLPLQVTFSFSESFPITLH
jgi:hypothetical protein